MSEDEKAIREDRSGSEFRALLDRAQRLESEGRFREGALLLTAQLPPGSTDLPDSALPLARCAAGLLSRAGDHRGAAEILIRCPIDLVLLVVDGTEPGVGLSAAAQAESSGRTDLALRLRAWLGHHAAAARLARQMGRHIEAGEFFFRAEMPLEASAAFAQGGDRSRAIEALLALGPGDPGYRSACIAAIRLASQAGEVSFALDRFLSTFVDYRPHDPSELDALTLLANLYVQHGLREDARRVSSALLAADPKHAIANQIRTTLKVMPSDFSDSQILPELPQAPSLPDPEDIVPLAGRLPLAGVFGVGTLVEGRYRLIDKIGRGGTSAIFKALDTILGDHIALKAFLQAVPDEKAERRIRRELRMARELTHQNIVRVHELGSHEGFRYITMELLEGVDLRDKMMAGLGIARGIDYIIQICDGLGAAHSRGIVHRDVKPENCFVTTTDVVKLLDFGIAKVVAAPGATVSGAILGTPAYISPEQITDYSGVSHRADLYSLGMVAYEVFAQRLPFGQPDLMTMIRLQMEAIPPSPREFRPAIPEALEKTILRLLEKDPDKRHVSCGELKDELVAIRPLVI